MTTLAHARCWPPALLASLLVVLVSGMPATASEFCGGNGVVKLAFADTPGLPATETASPDQTGMTTVDVWAVLDEVDRVEGPGGVMLAIGGFELTLDVQGAEPIILEKEILLPYRDFGQSQAECRVGTHPGQPFTDGRLALVRWRVGFQGEVSDVVFDLAPDGAASCATLEGCPGSGCRALYAGTVESRQEGFLFGAGSRPAVLNPTQDPDLAVRSCTVGWREVGVFGEPIERGDR